MASERSPAPAPDGAELLALVELALAEARSLGAAQAEAAVSMDVGLSVSARLGEVETVEYQRDRGMGVTVYFGTRKGTASTADLSPHALRETVGKACSIARFTAEDPCAGLPDLDTLASEVPDLDLAHPWDLSPEQACAMAIECEAAAMAVDPRITNSEGAGVSSHRGLRAYGNSLGFLAAYPGTLHSVSCAVLGVDGEEMERDYWYSTARDWRELEDVASVGRRSGERAVRRLGARKLATMKVPVLFSPEVARSLRRHGLPVRYGDGIAGEFLESLPLKDTRWVVSTLPDLASNRDLLRGLRELHFTGELAVVAREEFDGAPLKALGAPTILYPMRNAVDYAVEALTAIIRNKEAPS